MPTPTDVELKKLRAAIIVERIQRVDEVKVMRTEQMYCTVDVSGWRLK